MTTGTVEWESGKQNDGLPGRHPIRLPQFTLRETEDRDRWPALRHHWFVSKNLAIRASRNWPG